MSATATDTRNAVTVKGLRKAFGGEVILDGIDLELAEGTIFALLGPNGAGKTTIVRILSTLMRADAGELRVAGHDVVGDPDGVRAAIGVTGQVSAAAELLDRFDLVEAAGRRVSTYSGGMGSSAVAPSCSRPCQAGTSSSPGISPSPRSPRRSAASSAGRPSARTPSRPWAGASASPSSPTSGPGTSTHTAGPADVRQLLADDGSRRSDELLRPHPSRASAALPTPPST